MKKMSILFFKGILICILSASSLMAGSDEGEATTEVEDAGAVEPDFLGLDWSKELKNNKLPKYS